MRLIDADRAMEIVRDQGIAHPNAYHLTNYATHIRRAIPVPPVGRQQRRRAEHRKSQRQQHLQGQAAHAGDYGQTAAVAGQGRHIRRQQAAAVLQQAAGGMGGDQPELPAAVPREEKDARRH